MDRKYIDNERIVDRYLAGELTVREARDFEKYCLEHPDFLNSMPIPVRLKARLARRPQDDSETGMFQAIPSSATRAALETADDDFDVENGREYSRSRGGALGNRMLVIALGAGLLAALIGLIAYAMRADSLADELTQMKREAAAVSLQAPTGVRKVRTEPVRAKPAAATVALGWLTPPQLLDLHIDVSEGRYSQFLITIDKEDGTRVMQLRRIARDSNRELRVGLNSSAFGPGDYLMEIEGYNWRGQTETIGWVRLALQ
jgi:hypothetical protein